MACIRSPTGLEGGEVVVGPDGVVGRLMRGTMFVADGTEGVVGALIVVVGRGNWLGGPAGRPGRHVPIRILPGKTRG